MLMMLGLGLLVTLIAAWVGMIVALTHGGRLRRLEEAVNRLQPGAESAPTPTPMPTPAPASTPEPPPSQAASADDWEPEAAQTTQEDSDARLAPPVSHPPATVAGMFRALERSLAGNWLVWVAGAALALGGVMLAKYAIDRGLIGPWARIAAAALAGAAMLGAGEWLRRKPEAPGRVHSLAPAVLSAAGLITLYGDVYAGFAAFGLIPGLLAFVLLAAVSAGALFLAWLHGPVIAAFGIAGGFAAPILIGADAPNAAALFAYVFGVTAASLAMARFARWRWTAWLSLAGGAGWPALWLLGAFDESQALALALYLPALAAAATAFAWGEADTAPPIRRLWPRTAMFAPSSVLAAYACLIAACALTLWLLAAWSYSIAGVVALFALCALALAAAWRRESFAFFPLVAGAAAAAVAWLWPETLAGDTAGARRILTSAAALASLFGVGGFLAQTRLGLKGPMAVVSAGVPVAILIVLAFRLGAPDDAPYWATVLALAAVIELAVVEILVRSGRGAASPGPVAAYALGACAAVLGAVIVLLDEQWIGTGIAAEAAAAAWLMRRWGSPALVWAAGLLGLAAAYQLTLGASYLAGPPRDVAGGASLVLAYVLAVAGLDAASRLLRRAHIMREHWAVRTLDGAAAALAGVAAFIALRLVLNAGSLTRSYDNLLELGLQSGVWLAAPLALRLRVPGRLTVVQRAAEGVLVVLALLQIVFLHLVIANPWGGSVSAFVSGPPVANVLLIAYALPALLFGALAFLWRRRGFATAPYAACGAAVLFFVWITLETRRVFHAPDLSRGAVSDVEGWAYSAVWLIGAAMVMAWGVARSVPILRYMALCALIVTTLKVFVFDLAGLEGLWRALSFLGLGAALMAIAVIYQRVVLPGEGAKVKAA